MKCIFMQKFVAIICLFLFVFTAQAQLTVNELGKIEIGQNPVNDTAIVPPALLDTITTIRVFGTGASGSNARMGFGDLSSVRAMNVLIGERQGGDTDQMWLHGKKGIYFTVNHIAGDTISWRSSKL